MPSVADFEQVKRRTEAAWANAAVNPGVTGFQVQPGTRWNPGLPPEEIDAYERALGTRFPASFRTMLSVMNGVDRVAVNVYASTGHPVLHRPQIYTWPRDLELVREVISWTAEDREGIAEVLTEQGFRLDPDAALVPIYAHRYLVCGPDPLDGPVLSIVGTDAIVYGGDLLDFLYRDLVSGTPLA